MFKAIKLAIKYKDLLEPAIEMIRVVQDSVKDGQLTEEERSAIFSQMWVIIKKVQLIKQSPKI